MGRMGILHDWADTGQGASSLRSFLLPVKSVSASERKIKKKKKKEKDKEEEEKKKKKR